MECTQLVDSDKCFEIIHSHPIHANRRHRSQSYRTHLDLSHFHKFDELAKATKDNKDSVELERRGPELVLHNVAIHRLDRLQRLSDNFDFAVSNDDKSPMAMLQRNSASPEIDLVKHFERPDLVMKCWRCL